MNSEQLIEEGRRLVRPCVHLTQSEGAPLAAIWGGSGLVAPSGDGSLLRHWMSFDCRFLPQGYNDLSGCLSIYVDAQEEGGTVAVDRSMQLSALPASGTALFAHLSSSWPPIDAVFRFGSLIVKEWIVECGWQPEWLYNSNFRGHDVVAVYEDYVRQRNPLFGEVQGVFAMLGGWHEPWPENDWPDLLAKKLIVFTYQDAEPYVEVWADDSQNFQVIQRIT